MQPNYKTPTVWVAPIRSAVAVDGGVLDEWPKVVRATPPEFPPLNGEAGLEGLVTVAVVVGVNGKVEQFRLIESIGTLPMQSAVKQAVPAFEFRPGMRSGQPVACRVEIPIHFEQR